MRASAGGRVAHGQAARKLELARPGSGSLRSTLKLDSGVVASLTLIAFPRAQVSMAARRNPREE
jgi:hypothetical protein